MKPIRYFRDGDWFWKFEEGRRPRRKTGRGGEWEYSFFGCINEFLKDPGAVREIEPEEAGDS